MEMYGHQLFTPMHRICEGQAQVKQGAIKELNFHREGDIGRFDQHLFELRYI